MNNQPKIGTKELVAVCKENPILLEVLLNNAKPLDESPQLQTAGEYMGWLESLTADEFKLVGLCVEAKTWKQGGHQYA